MRPPLHKVRPPQAPRNHGPLGRRIPTPHPSAARRLPALLLALVALACGDDRGVEPTPPLPVRVATVTVSPAGLTLEVGGTAQLAAVARSASGAELEDREIAWSSSADDIVTLDANGLVRARAAGIATISATSEGRTGTAVVAVAAPGGGEEPPPALPTIAALSPAQITEGWGGDFTITVTGGGFAPGAVVLFQGRPLETHVVGPAELRARVTAAEVALAGRFAVTVRNPPLPDGPASAPATFTVVARPPSAVRVASPFGHLWTWAGERLQLEATALDLAGEPLPGRTFSWSSSRPDVATLYPAAPSVVLGRAPGEAAVTAAADGVPGHAAVRVLQAPAFDMVWDHGVGHARRLAFWSPGLGGQPTTIPTGITAYDPSPSPDGGWIAFTGVGADGNVDVYIVGRHGSGLARLTNAAAVDDSPAWSPDGTRIAYRSTRAGRSDVWVMNADGSGHTRLTPEAGAANVGSGDPAWSPDGTQLVYAHGTDGNRDLWIMRADGGARRRFAADADDEREPAWSALTNVIAYRRGSGSLARIVLRSADDGSQVVGTFLPGTGATPAYSPDGRWLAFARQRAAGTSLQALPTDGSTGERAMFPASFDVGANVAWMKR